MPSTSQAQHGLMAMASTEAGRRKLRAHGKKPPPASVAKEFLHADKGRKIGKLARHAKKK